MDDILQIHPADNVAVLLREQGDIPPGHKLALQGIPRGEAVIKYGHPIGSASRDISPGEWVHSHNLTTRLSGTLSYCYEPDWREPSPLPGRTFQGYRRPNGKVGIRNEVWILPTVGCVNAVARQIEQAAQEYAAGLDGVFAYSHPYGCSQLGADQDRTRQALCGLIQHPNAGGVLVLGLGCENSSIAELQRLLPTMDQRRVRFLNCQDCADEVVAARPLLEELCGYAASFRREACDASELVVGLKCGGSDGFSGITANPLLGQFADALTARGGSVILTEVPEMFGAETLLMNRCRTEAVFQKTVGLINGFKDYFLSHGEPVGENPSPGNREGGITTLEEKSLGCVQKGGTAPVEAVLSCGELIQKKGLSLLEAPGNDLVASAALAISGAQLVLFTTGRGTPFGCPVPTVKISSNSALAERKASWIDFDAGQLLGGANRETVAADFFDYVISLASGKCKAKSEALDKHDLSIWKDGVTL